MRPAAFILMLAAVVIGASAMSTKPSAKSRKKGMSSLCDEAGKGQSADRLTVFLTGNELGVLKPCGCFGGQLGGLARRSAILNTVPGQKRLTVATGHFVKDESEQELIKFNIMIRAFDLLNYDLVNLAQRDFEIAQSLGLLDDTVARFLSADAAQTQKGHAKSTQHFSLAGKMVTVTIAAFDAESMPAQQLQEVFETSANRPAINILILNRCDADVVAAVAKTQAVDCLVCPAEADEAMQISGPNEKPLIVSAGRYGKYIGRLDISPGQDTGKPKLRFLPVPVTEDLQPEKALVDLYEFYQQLVKEANLLETYPRGPLPNGLEYVGSKSCKVCHHEYEYEKWSTKAHAHAYATLEKVGSQYDPECVICHVVGMEYESGFICEEKSSEDLKNVGCEVCHGPGSEHVRTLGKSKTTAPKAVCIDCHTPEHSANYAGHEQEYFQKIVHWREPNKADSVKKTEVLNK